MRMAGVPFAPAIPNGEERNCAAIIDFPIVNVKTTGLRLGMRGVAALYFVRSSAQLVPHMLSANVGDAPKISVVATATLMITFVAAKPIPYLTSTSSIASRLGPSIIAARVSPRR